MESDFSGYATRAGLKCSDGRTIMPDAFKHQDTMQVPLVWQHGHTDPENVLGHVILENREDGVYAYGFFNNSAKAQHMKEAVEHRDIRQMSIWANDLIERSKRVLHGAIREVSLVLSGANPGAIIENVTIRHADGDSIVLEDEAIIYTGLELEHSSDEEEPEASDNPAEEGDDLTHADDEGDADDDETVAEVYESMTEKQKNVLHYMVGQALEAGSDSNAEHSNTDNGEDQEDKEGSDTMSHNVFEKDEAPTGHVLSHSDVQTIVADAGRLGSLRDAVEQFALSHGITDIDQLFPDATLINGQPEWHSRRMEWVAKVLGAAHKSPFSRIKTIHADITEEEARAKGYITGTLKKEEFFPVAKRVTTPTTVYKKQKLDRDDMVDITDFDVVTWLKGEMRLMLDEELARAILVGDGRDVAHEDKINEGNIRPIASDHELYATVVNVNIDDSNSSVTEIIDAVILNRHKYKGSGLPTMFTTETYIARFLLLKDTLGRRIYRTLDEIATELRVAEIVPVDAMEGSPDVVAVLVNMADYNVGADKGGQVSMFDDFDIDYNQYKYLIETRMSGALTKLKSAIVVKKVAGSATLATPTAPTFNSNTGVVTIPTVTGVSYRNAATPGTPLSAGAMSAIAAGASVTIIAVPSSASYYFASSDDDEWTFTRESV